MICLLNLHEKQKETSNLNTQSLFNNILEASYQPFCINGSCFHGSPKLLLKLFIIQLVFLYIHF